MNQLTRKRALLLTGLSTLLIFGCAEPPGRTTPLPLERQAQMREEVNILQQEVRSLRAALEERDRIFSADALTRIEGRLGEVEKKLKTAEEAWDRKMTAVVEAVKSENAELRGAMEKMRGGASSQGSEYMVKKGDTLSAIAKRHGVRLQDITEANEIENPAAIKEGQKLHIPGPAR